MLKQMQDLELKIKERELRMRDLESQLAAKKVVIVLQNA